MINAQASVLYGIVADYKVGHPAILPSPPFLYLKVLEGGYGAGTKVEFAMTFFGKTNVEQAVVSEPEPGRILKEQTVINPLTTYFKFEPKETGCLVTIRSELTRNKGIGGFLQMKLIKKLIHPVYRQELSKLALEAKKRS